MFDSGITAKDLINEVKGEVDVALPIPNASYVTWLNSLEQFLYSSIIREQNKVTAPTPYTGTVRLSALPIASNEAPIRFEDIYTVYADTEQLIKTNTASGTVFGGCYWKYNNDMAYSVAKTPDRLDIIYYAKPALKAVDNNDNIIEANPYEMYPQKYIDNTPSMEGETFVFINDTDKDITNWPINRWSTHYDTQMFYTFSKTIPKATKWYCRTTRDADDVDGPGYIEVLNQVMDTNYNVMIPIEFIELVKSKLRAEAYMIENEYTPAANWMNNYNVLLENFKQWLSERAATFGM